MEVMTSPVSVAAPYTITDCEYCGKPFNEGDSIVVTDDGEIKQCMHWHLNEER